MEVLKDREYGTLQMDAYRPAKVDRPTRSSPRLRPARVQGAVSASREVNQVARLATLATLLVTGFVVACVRAQPPEAMTVVRLRDNLFVIAGDGGNTAVFVRPEGVVLVDTKVANRGQRILDLVRTLTDKPITHIINTHSHSITSAVTPSFRRRSRSWPTKAPRGRW